MKAPESDAQKEHDVSQVFMLYQTVRATAKIYGVERSFLDAVYKDLTHYGVIKDEPYEPEKTP